MMRQQHEIREMASHARGEEQRAKLVRSDADPAWAEAFAAGAEAGLLWAAGDIKSIPFFQLPEDGQND
jgi:hypothetical protein